MHNYFANGICSSEMLAFQERFSKTTGFTLKDLQQSVHEVAWVCRDKSFRAPSSRSWLFNEQFWQGEMYKGSASQTYFALPLLVHYGNLLTNVDDLPCLESLNALYQVVLELKKCRRGCGDYTQLESSQGHHQRLFILGCTCLINTEGSGTAIAGHAKHDTRLIRQVLQMTFPPSL